MPRLQVWETVQDSYRFVFGNRTGFIGESAKPALATVISYTLFRLSLNVMQRYQIAAKNAPKPADGGMGPGGMPPPMPGGHFGPGGPGGFGGHGHPPLMPMLMHFVHQLLPVLPVVFFAILMLLCFFSLASALVRHVRGMPQLHTSPLGFLNRDSWRMLAAILLFIISFAAIEGMVFGYAKLLQIAGGGTHATLGSDLFLLGQIIMGFGGIYIFLRGIWLLIPTVVAEQRVLALRSWSLGGGLFPEFFLILILTIIPVWIVHHLVNAAFASTDANAILYAPSIISGLLSRQGLHLLFDYVCGAVFWIYVLMLIVKGQASCYIGSLAVARAGAAAPSQGSGASFQN